MLKTNRNAQNCLDPEFFLCFFKEISEKNELLTGKNHFFLLKPLISCFLLSLFQQSEQNPKKWDNYSRDLAGFCCFDELYSLGLALLTKTELNNEKIASFSLENTEKIHFSFLFRGILAAFDNLTRIFEFFAEKAKIIEFLEQNPDFLPKNTEIYEIFKPKLSKPSDFSEKRCEELKNTIFSLISDDKKPDFTEKSCFLLDFLNTRDFRLYCLPRLPEICANLDSFLLIFLNNQTLLREFDVSMGKLAKNIDFLMKIMRKPLLFSLNSRIIDYFHSKFLIFSDKSRLDSDLLSIRLLLSDTQFEAFSHKALDSLAEQDLGPDEVLFIRKNCFFTRFFLIFWLVFPQFPKKNAV